MIWKNRILKIPYQSYCFNILFNEILNLCYIACMMICRFLVNGGYIKLFYNFLCKNTKYEKSTDIENNEWRRKYLRDKDTFYFDKSINLYFTSECFLITTKKPLLISWEIKSLLFADIILLVFLNIK